MLLVSCYELGHAPHALASAQAALRAAGFDPAVLDLAVDRLDPDAVARAELVALSVPMHTALRMALEAAGKIRALAPTVRLGFFGHYAMLNAELLCRREGAVFALGGELEAELTRVVTALDRGDAPPSTVAAPLVKLGRALPRPDRRGLPPPQRYAHLIDERGQTRVAGYTETTRGCLDTCRHCPVPAVYGGRFFVVPAEVVLDDVAAQVAAGARHITFGDPDFFNGPGHSMAVVRRMAERFPGLSFDITAQVSHLLRQPQLLRELRALGCAFVTTAVESLSERVLAALAKRHRRPDVERLLDLADQVGLVIRPTLVPFTPWTELANLVELGDFIHARALGDRVAPVQLSIRLLVPPGSLLLERPELAGALGPLDPAALGHRWQHPDPRVDALQHELALLADRDARQDRDPAATLDDMRRLIYRAAGLAAPVGDPAPPPRTSARLSEPWFCCSEPLGDAVLGRAGAGAGSDGHTAGQDPSRGLV